MTTIISIDGNIGSGKSTLIKLLKTKFNSDKFVFIQEPIELWLNNKDEFGENILTKFYRNQEKYAFPFQMMAYISRLHLIKQAVKCNPDKIIITERCCHTDKNVFATMLHDDKKIEDVCYNIYLGWFNEFFDELKFDNIIYVNTLPDKCHERINKRLRDGESEIPLEYLKKCDKYHHDWLKNVNNVLQLDGNVEFETDKQVLIGWENQIIDFVNNLQNVK